MNKCKVSHTYDNIYVAKLNEHEVLLEQEKKIEFCVWPLFKDHTILIADEEDGVKRYEIRSFDCQIPRIGEMAKKWRMPHFVIITQEGEPIFVYRHSEWGYGKCARAIRESGLSIAIFGQTGEYQRQCAPPYCSDLELAMAVIVARDKATTSDCCGFEEAGGRILLSASSLKIKEV